MRGVLEGRVALITGGTGALGRGVVRAFLEGGARVHVPWVVREELDPFRTALAEVPGADQVRLHEADVSDPRAVDALVEAVLARDGRLDVLVNGVGGFVAASLEETGPEDWNRMITLNATTAFLCSRAAAAAMPSGSGRIINVAALPAVDRGAARMSAYAASKAAVLNLTQSLSRELRSRGITVNAVVPTVIDTPANRESMSGTDRATWLQPLEIGRVMRFLASDDAAIVTGTAVMLARG